MTDFSRPGTRPDQRRPDPATVTSRRRLAYSGDSTFQRELRTRVNAYFLENGRRRQDIAAWYFKAACILTTFAASYVLLVFFASTWWQAVALTVVLALSVVGADSTFKPPASARQRVPTVR